MYIAKPIRQMSAWALHRRVGRKEKGREVEWDLVEMWVRGGACWIRCFFGLQGLPVTNFYFKIGLDIHVDRISAKCLIFDDFFLKLTYRLSKCTSETQFT